MGIVEIETAEAIEVGNRFIKELQDILDATEAAEGSNNEAVGHNEKRAAANDGINITRNILRRLGAAPIPPVSKRPKPAPEPPKQPTESVLEELEATKTNLEKAIEENGQAVDAVIEGEAESPPEAIADLFDPELTPRENQDALMTKFAAAKNAEEHARAGGDMASAMQHLKNAERYESGIKWNRAVHAEVLG